MAKINISKLAEELADRELNNEARNNFLIKYNRKPNQEELYTELYEQDENVDLEGKPCYVLKRVYAILYNGLVDEFILLIEDFKQE